MRLPEAFWALTGQGSDMAVRRWGQSGQKRRRERPRSLCAGKLRARLSGRFHRPGTAEAEENATVHVAVASYRWD